MHKLISPGLSPNLETVDVVAALKLLFSPFKLKTGDSIAKVEGWFRYNFDIKYSFSFSSARESLYALLVSLNISDNDEVIVQAFTCVAAVNPILWVGARPVFADIKASNLSMDPSDLRRKITKKTKAIIVQHTFGIPGDIEKIKSIASAHNIFLIEDCAHVIGGITGQRKLGTFADAAIFSFGRDKAVSSVFGGLVLVKRKNIADKLAAIENLTPFPSYIWIYQQLLHPILTFIVLRGFYFHPNFGRVLLSVFKNLHFISKPIREFEEQTYSGKGRIKRMPNALAVLALSQLVRSQRFNRTRRETSKKYFELLPMNLRDISYNNSVPYLRYPILSTKRRRLYEYCRNESIYLGDWYSNTIDPKGVDFKKIGYKLGSCPEAERVSSVIVNLPTYPTLTSVDIERVVSCVLSFFKKNGKKS